MVTARLFFRLGDEAVRLGLHARVSPGACCARPSARVGRPWPVSPILRFGPARGVGWL